RLPIPKGRAVGRGRFPIPDCRFPREGRWGEADSPFPIAHSHGKGSGERPPTQAAANGGRPLPAGEAPPGALAASRREPQATASRSRPQAPLPAARCGIVHGRTLLARAMPAPSRLQNLINSSLATSAADRTITHVNPSDTRDVVALVPEG